MSISRHINTTRSWKSISLVKAMYRKLQKKLLASVTLLSCKSTNFKPFKKGLSNPLYAAKPHFNASLTHSVWWENAFALMDTSFHQMMTIFVLKKKMIKRPQNVKIWTVIEEFANYEMMVRPTVTALTPCTMVHTATITFVPAFAWMGACVSLSTIRQFSLFY